MTAQPVPHIYRAYTLQADGRIQSAEPLDCTNDDDAIAAAKLLVDGHDVELWDAGRKVILLPRHSSPR